MTYQDKRRFTRVQILKNLAGLVPELHAQVCWPNHEISSVMDLSYKGMAVRRPGVFPIGAQQKVVVGVELGGCPSFQADVRIAWCNMDWVGLEFSVLPPEGHQAMTDFLDAKLVGSSLKPVERAFIDKHEKFQYWYQGLKQTHVFLWTNSANEVEKVVVDMAGTAVELSKGQKNFRLTPDRRRAILVLSQMDQANLAEFVRSILLEA